MSRTGRIDTSLTAKEVLDAYYWDRMEAAYDGALAMGTGPGGGGAILYRQIEGEYLTRKVAETAELSSWLTAEFGPAEVTLTDDIRSTITQACDDVAKRLAWQHGAPVMISVLTQDADAPWAVGRFGYFVDKYPYDKICIPLRSLADSDALRSVVMHEYSHAIVLNLATGHAPRWMDEMIAMTMQGELDKEIAKGFAEGKFPWLKPIDVGVNYLAEREGKTKELVHLAYQQSACIGAYLVMNFGEQSLNKLLISFSDNSFIEELAIRAASINPADEAIKETYRMNERQLFAAAHKWLVETFSS